MSNRSLFLDSSRASTAGAGQWTWLYPSAVTLGPPGSRVKASVSLFTFYHLAPNVTAANNRVVVSGTEIIVSPGQYEIGRLLAVINDALDAPAATLDENSMRVTLTPPVPHTVEGPLLRLLGWPDAGPYTGTSMTAPGVIAMGGTQYYSLETSMPTSNLVNDDTAGACLCRVPTGGAYGELVVYSGQDVSSTVLAHELTSLTIRILDDEGAAVTFDGAPWSMNLYFEAIMDPDYRLLSSFYVGQQAKPTDDPNRIPTQID